MTHTHQRRCTLSLTWPVPPLNVVLVEPEIPQNTGNIARLCAATGTRLHLVGALGFRLTDARLRRAGLDYWDAVDLTRHANLEDLRGSLASSQFYYLTTRGPVSYTAVNYRPGDTFVFGGESRGLPDQVLESGQSHVVGIPIRADRVRSLNLANSVAIVLYEALRQIDLPQETRRG